MDIFSAARRTMVENQLRTYDVTDHTVLAAFESVPRELFVAPAQAEMAYLDREQPTRDGKTRLLTPMVHARLLQALDVAPGETALDVGSAGYGAAILVACGAKVTALEADAEATRGALQAAGVAGVDVVAGDAGTGAANRGPFNVILVHGAAEVQPEALLAQLAEGGRLGVVMGTGRSGRATVFRKVSGKAGGACAFDAAAPTLAALARKSEFAF